MPALGQVAAWWPTVEAEANNTGIDGSHKFIAMTRFIAFSECNKQSSERAVDYLYGGKRKKSTNQQTIRDTNEE